MNATPVYRSVRLHILCMQSDRTVNPRPWRKGDRIIVDCTNAPVTGLVPSRMRPEIENLILRAVNSYDAMKEALDTLLQYAIYGLDGLPGPDHSLTRAVEKAQAALALANGSRER